MKVEFTVPEVIEIFNEIQKKSEALFEMIRFGLQQTEGEYLTAIMSAELIFYNFPEEEWISLRTTNIIERLNKEFKRRTKPMEILAGENACYRLLAFISLRMELHWRSNPIGKVRNSLTLFKKLAWNNFAQKN